MQNALIKIVETDSVQHKKIFYWENQGLCCDIKAEIRYLSKYLVPTTINMKQNSE